jgi:hypothetical protein
MTLLKLLPRDSHFTENLLPAVLKISGGCKETWRILIGKNIEKLLLQPSLAR